MRCLVVCAIANDTSRGAVSNQGAEDCTCV
jgi:hypothetical protein